MGIKICPRCDGLMIKQLGSYGFYYLCKHCNYEIIDKGDLI